MGEGRIITKTLETLETENLGADQVSGDPSRLVSNKKHKYEKHEEGT